MTLTADAAFGRSVSETQSMCFAKLRSFAYVAGGIENCTDFGLLFIFIFRLLENPPESKGKLQQDIDSTLFYIIHYVLTESNTHTPDISEKTYDF